MSAHCLDLLQPAKEMLNSFIVLSTMTVSIYLSIYLANSINIVKGVSIHFEENVKACLSLPCGSV